jgi:hypothetical protein
VCASWNFGQGLRDKSKRDSSISRADSFAGAKLKKKRRLASVGMTGLNALIYNLPKLSELRICNNDCFILRARAKVSGEIG